jgi:threonine dehydrogenase-like Zn-dependent dehydrogenase
MGSGQANVKAYNRYLRDLIFAGRAKPSWIVSHEISLQEAPDAYEKFDSREDGWTKVILHRLAVAEQKENGKNRRETDTLNGS